MLNSSASSVKTGDKVIVTQLIPRHVLRDSYTATDDLWQWLSVRDGTSNTLGFQDIPRGTIGRVEGTRAGYVQLSIGTDATGSRGIIAILIGLKESVFEKYFAERL